MNQTRPRPTVLLCLWLMLATIFGHALLPAGSPLARTNGSAFSVSTVDVSIAPKRRALLGPTKKSRDPSTAAADPAVSGQMPALAAGMVAASTATGTAAIPEAWSSSAAAGLAGLRAHPPRAPPSA